MLVHCFPVTIEGYLTKFGLTYVIPPAGNPQLQRDSVYEHIQAIRAAEQSAPREGTPPPNEVRARSSSLNGNGAEPTNDDSDQPTVGEE